MYISETSVFIAELYNRKLISSEALAKSIGRLLVDSSGTAVDDYVMVLSFDMLAFPSC